MDNYVKDNKNRYLLAFISLLITREVFEEVQMGYLVVGPTHEDINKCFGYLFKKSKEQNNYILADLMKIFMVSQERPFIPQLIQKILDFKIGSLVV
jgi:hypothetical protein